MAFNFLANTAAILSLTSTGIEAGKKGVKDAKYSAQTKVAISDIRNVTGDSMLNTESEKHKAMKESMRNLDLWTKTRKVIGATTGFVSGASKIIKNNIPQIGFSALTLAAGNKHTKLKTIGVIGIGISTLYDFLKNGTNLFTKKDMIEK